MPRPRIFVSAVSTELRQARRRVAAALHRLGYDTTSQDDFPTGHGELRAWLAAQVGACDGVFQLIGAAYGAEPPPSADPADPWPDPEFGRCSYTQFELLHARRLAKLTWVLEVGPECGRDSPMESLDLPRRAEDDPAGDPLAYQAERRALQLAYVERLRAANHIRNKAASDAELELAVHRLRDELEKLRAQESRGRRRLGWVLAAVLAGILALGGGGWWAYQSLSVKTEAIAVVTPERIRAQLLAAVQDTYRRQLAEAEGLADWKGRERAREAAQAQRAAQSGRVDELTASFEELAAGSKAGSVFAELTRILQEQGVGEALAYMETQRPGILSRVRARRAAAQAKDRAELEPLLTSAGLYAAEGSADAARGIYGEVLGLAPDWPQALDAHRRFLIDQGGLASIRGNLAAAGRDYRLALERAERLVELEPENRDWQRNLAAAWSWIGDLEVALGHGDTALAAYQRYYDGISRLAAADPNNAGWQRGLSVSLEKLGNLRSAQGDLAGAAQRCEESRAIAERLAAADPSNAGWQRDLSVSLNKLGDLRSAQGDLAGAAQRYEESRAIFERLAAADPSNTGWQRDLSVSLNQLGDLRSAQGDLAGAAQRFEESRAIAARLAAADPSNAGWQRDLAVSHYKLGAVADGQGEEETLRRHWGAMLAIFDALERGGLHIAPADRAVLERIRARAEAPSTSVRTEE